MSFIDFSPEKYTAADLTFDMKYSICLGSVVEVLEATTSVAQSLTWHSGQNLQADNRYFMSKVFHTWV